MGFFFREVVEMYILFEGRRGVAVRLIILVIGVRCLCDFGILFKGFEFSFFSVKGE